MDTNPDHLSQACVLYLCSAEHCCCTRWCICCQKLRQWSYRSVRTAAWWTHMQCCWCCMMMDSLHFPEQVFCRMWLHCWAARSQWQPQTHSPKWCSGRQGHMALWGKKDCLKGCAWNTWCRRFACIPNNLKLINKIKNCPVFNKKIYNCWCSDNFYEEMYMEGISSVSMCLNLDVCACVNYLTWMQLCDWVSSHTALVANSNHANAVHIATQQIGHITESSSGVASCHVPLGIKSLDFIRLCPTIRIPLYLCTVGLAVQAGINTQRRTGLWRIVKDRGRERY